MGKMKTKTKQRSWFENDMFQRDLSLKQLEDYLIKYTLISTTISNLKNGISDKRRQRYAIYRIIMDFGQAVRYAISLWLIYAKSPKYLTWCYLAGEYFFAYDAVAIFIYFYGVFLCTLCGLFRLTMYVCETNGQLHFLTLYDSLLDGNGQEMGLTRANLMKFRKTLQLSMATFKICEKFWLGCVIVHLVPFVMAMMTRPPAYMVVYFIVWFFFIASCYSQVWGVKSILPLICYLSYVYFKLKYSQIKCALDHYIARDQNQHLVVRARQLERILRKHNCPGWSSP
ncbi:hypothetical protein HDE_13116 [Halotydeus destructor]|nr:hypothetical protein HDE_13116 [Halotydeus destructor]